MKGKKLFALVLAAAMALSVTACSSSEGSSAPDGNGWRRSFGKDGQPQLGRSRKRYARQL